MDSYGRAVLESVPKDSLLVSQTDLNWNTVRYLQTCEHLRPDVTHLSTQLLPYPWFQRQHVRYPTVKFPAVLPDATTDKKTRQHARDLARLFDENESRFEGGIYLDIHAIHDLHLREGNQYLDTAFHLLPNGLTFKVARGQASSKSGGRTAKVLRKAKWSTLEQRALDQLDDAFSVAPTTQYPEGSWEHAAGKVYWDAHYQHALLLLSSSMSAARAKKAKSPAAKPIVRAANLLADVVAAHDAGYAVSYKFQDVLKNAALAHVNVLRILKTEEQQQSLGKSMIPLLQRYLAGAKGDPDARTFANYLDVLLKTVK